MSLLADNGPERPELKPGPRSWPTGIFGPSPTFSIPVLRWGAAAGDAGLIVLAAMIGGRGYQYLVPSAQSDFNALLGAGLTGALLYVLIAHAFGLYRLTSLVSSGGGDLRRAAALWSIVVLLLALLAFLLRIGSEFSRGSIISFELLALVFILLFRRFVKQTASAALADDRARGRRTILMGTAAELDLLQPAVLLRAFGVSEVGRVVLGDGEEDVQRALILAGARKAEEIALALSWNDPASIELMQSRLRALPLPVRLLPDCHVRSIAGRPSYGQGESFTIELQRGPLSLAEQFIKRGFDLIVAAAILIVLSPLMLLTALAIRLDSAGPVLFLQRRAGFNGVPFRIYKFRTMSVMEDGPNVKQARRGDPRVTRVGRILRQSSLDELPQLFNVIAGGMSLIGPRPHALSHDDQYSRLVAEYALRHHVKPGMTGWAQVNGCRGQINDVDQIKARIDHDLWYINNWSLVLDLRIMAMTCFEVLRQRDAF